MHTRSHTFSLTVTLPLLQLDVVPLFILKDEFIKKLKININVHNKLPENFQTGGYSNQLIIKQWLVPQFIFFAHRNRPVS